MKITTPQGILEGDNIEAILKEHGFHCLYGADLRHADLSHADLRGADLSGADLSDANLSGADLQDKQGNSLPPDTTAHSGYDTDFTYKKGETIHVEDFDTNRWNECAPGIHFFITRIEAAEY